MDKRELYLSLGSNQGDRSANLLQAVRMLDEGLKMPHSALSGLLAFPSWGFEGPEFLNCAVRYELPDAIIQLSSAKTDEIHHRRKQYAYKKDCK